MRPAVLLVLALLGGGTWLYVQQPQLLGDLLPGVGEPVSPAAAVPGGQSPGPISEALFASDPMSIASQRARTYPGSALTVRQTLSRGGSYTRQVVSYQSEGLRINALLTVPDGTPPKAGWPAIVFNHGYIPPN